MVLSMLFPERCKYCDRVIDLRRTMCKACENTLYTIGKDICKKCGAEKEFCCCEGQKMFYECVCAPFYYEGAATKGLHNLKFRNRPEVADVFAKEMAECFINNYSEFSFDYCTFVPSTKDNVKERGYNQAQLLAEGMCSIIGLECKELLFKLFNTKPQHTLKGIERSGNLLGAFAVNDKVNIENKRILLCDDIKTTGSTLNECAKTLLIGGAAEVFCITAAIARKTE